MLLLDDSKLEDITYQKELLIILMTKTKNKNFYDQGIDSDIKRYEEIRKLTTGQGEDYTTGCLLDYYYIKYNYTLIAFDLSKQKELDTDPKAIQQLEFVGQLKKLDNMNANAESMFVLTTYVCLNKFRTNKRNEIIIFSRKCNSIIKDAKLSRSES